MTRRSLGIRTSALRSLASAVLVQMAATGCGGGGDSTGSQPPVTSVTVAPNPSSIEVGGTVQLTATLKDADANELSGRSVTWSSDATGVATVTGGGLVAGVAVGSANVTATSENKSGAAVVTVTSAVGSGDPIPPGQSAALLSGAEKAGVTRFFKYLYIGAVLNQVLADPNAPRSGQATPFPRTGFSQFSSSPGSGTGLLKTAPITSTVLFAGGYEDATSVNATRRAVSYDPEANEATVLQMTVARIYHTQTPLSGSRALLAGGFDGDAVLSSAEIFTESTLEFAATGSMGTARGRHASAPLPDGRVLVTGGLIPVGGGPTTIDTRTTEIFDPAAGTFTPGPDMSVARFNHSAIALDDGRVLVLGGNQLSSAEVYDPVGGDFTPVGDMNSVHGLGHRAVKLLDGKVLVLAGDEGTIQPSAVAELFDPATDQFTRIADMTTTRMLHFAVVNENDGSVFIGGGQNAAGDLLASTELYDPVTKTFAPSTDMPVEDSEQAAVFVQR